MAKRVGKAEKSELKGLVPDEWDEKNIRRLIDMWDKVHPRGQIRYLGDEKNPKKMYIEYMNITDHLNYMHQVIKKDRKISLKANKSDGPIRLSASLPPSFANELRKSYPTLLTDKRQCAWFLRKFPQFNLDK